MVLIPKLIYIFKYTCNYKYTDRDIKRFISKIDISPGLGPNGNCWEWKMYLDKDKYGQFGCCKNNVVKTYKSHRMSFELFTNKLVPEGLCVCHTCDNPSCCNPNHLFLGTHQDNMKDKIKKNRQPCGENMYNSKQTWNNINNIRTLYNNGTYTIEELAKKFLTGIGDISRIIANKTWYDPNYVRVMFHNGNSKLNQNKADKIRKLWATGKYTQKQLGKLFKTDRANIGYIIRNKTWIDSKIKENVIER